MKEVSQLVEAAQAGDSEAYAALVQRFQGMAYAIASRYVGDHHLAQDLVQDAVIGAFLHLPQLKDPSAFPGWFRQIVFRQCTRVLRQATLSSSSLEAVSADLVAERDTEDLVMQAERQASVRSALASLPRHEQLVAALFYGCGYSYKEVSAFLKIPITTVKKRLYSARQKLRMQLQATLRDEIEHANARPANHEEATERAGSAIRMARVLKRVAYTLENERSPTDELQALVEQLGARDWKVADAALAARGEAGIAAVIWGLCHPNVRVRGGCAGFMDHHGTDACFAPLRQVALHDPAPSVRRMAVHSATCQECKPCPLTGELVGLLVEVALRDPNRRVRLYALWGLHRPQDPRAVAALKSILEEADPELQIAAYHALVSQDPTYQGDAVGLHVQVALSDAHKSERLKALLGLRRLPQDSRARAALEQILRTEADPRLRSYAHHALKHQDPSYKTAFDSKAREWGIAAARTRKEC